MAILSSIASAYKSATNAYKSATKSLQSAGASLAKAVTTNKQPAAAAAALPKAATTLPANATSAVTKQPTYVDTQNRQYEPVSKATYGTPITIEGLPGGNIAAAEAQQQYTPKPITPTSVRAGTTTASIPTAPAEVSQPRSASFASTGGTTTGFGTALGSTGGNMTGFQTSTGVTVPEYGSINANGQPNLYNQNTGELIPNPNATPTDVGLGSLESILKEYTPRKESILQNPEYVKAQAEYDAARARAATLSNQVTEINNRANAAALSTIGQGRGIPEAIIGGQQAQIYREAAIQSLPIQSQLAYAQGDAQTAQEHLTRLGSLLTEEANNKFEYQKSLASAVIGYATDVQKAQISSLIKQKETFATQQANIYQLLTQNNAPKAVWDAVRNAKSIDQLYQAAGKYGAQANNQIVELNNGRTVVVDKNTGRVVSTIFGGGSGGAPSGAEGQYTNDLDATIGTVLSTIDSKFGQQQFSNQIAKARNDSDKLNIVAAQVLKGQPAEFKNDFRNQAVGISQLDKAIAEIDKGVQTGLINNSQQYVYNLAGRDFDPRLAKINGYITAAIQPYRNSVTGAAWGDQEDAEYQQLFGSTRFAPQELRQRLVQTKELLKSKSAEGLNAVANPLGFGGNMFETGTFAVDNNTPSDDVLESEYNALTTGKPAGVVNYFKPVSDFFGSLVNSLFK